MAIPVCGESSPRITAATRPIITWMWSFFSCLMFVPSSGADSRIKFLYC